jgi:hypothetical protein
MRNKTVIRHAGLDTDPRVQAEMAAYMRDARHGRRSRLGEALPSSVIALSLRVETPWTYISASAATSAFSLLA